MIFHLKGTEPFIHDFTVFYRRMLNEVQRQRLRFREWNPLPSLSSQQSRALFHSFLPENVDGDAKTAFRLMTLHRRSRHHASRQVYSDVIYVRRVSIY